MSIEKAIEFLEREVREYKRMIDDRSLCLAGESAYEECQSRIDFDYEIIALLRTHPDAQPNEPLTETELRCMVGDWVWVTVKCYHYYTTSGWAVICTGTQIDFMGQMLDISDCGVKFTACRRPPKEDER